MYEYKVTNYPFKKPEEIETELNKLGVEGWELISVSGDFLGGAGYLFWKRNK